MTTTEKRTIYVELREEGTPCWRPVETVHLGSELYRIVGEKPDGEDWEFSAGDVVKCKMKKFQTGGPDLVAYEKMADDRTY
jgi:hypothetical protein